MLPSPPQGRNPSTGQCLTAKQLVLGLCPPAMRSRILKIGKVWGPARRHAAHRSGRSHGGGPVAVSNQSMVGTRPLSPSVGPIGTDRRVKPLRPPCLFTMGGAVEDRATEVSLP